MAIVKTEFTGLTQAANAAEVYAFLNANKNGYFDSVAKDSTTNLITCTVNSVQCLKLGFDGSAYGITITTANSSSESRGDKNLKWEYAYVTSKGLWLYSNAVFGGSAYPTSVFITNTDSGDTAIVAICTDSSSYMCLLTADVLNSSVAYRIETQGLYDHSGSFWNYTVYPSGLTTLTQIPLSETGVSYTPYLYFTQFSQYRFIPSVLTVGTTQYVYDGRIALKE